MNLEPFGKQLIFFGFILIVLGAVFLFGGKLSFLGQLPGDISIKKENFSFYFPITTSIIVSIVLSLLFWLFQKH